MQRSYCAMVALTLIFLVGTLVPSAPAMVRPAFSEAAFGPLNVVVEDTEQGGMEHVASDAGADTSNDGTPLPPAAPIGFYWARAYGGSGLDEIVSLVPTGNEGYIAVGYTGSFGAGGKDVWILKLDSVGQITWQRTYGGSGDDYGRCVEQTAEGGYIVAGYTYSYGAGAADVWVLKLYSTGFLDWTSTYGGTGDDRVSSVHQTADGGYLVAGHTNSYAIHPSDGWILKLNENGAVNWQYSYGDFLHDVEEEAYSMELTADGGCIIAGVVDTGDSDGRAADGWVAKLDSAGVITWTNRYGGGTNYEDEYFRSVAPTADGCYIVAGYTYSFGVSGADAWVLKLHPNGNVIWQKTYGGDGDEAACSVVPTADGEYIVAGYTNSFGAGGMDAWILKLDPDGGVTWAKTYGGVGDDRAFSVNQTADGGYIFAGYTSSFGPAAENAWVVEVGSEGGIIWDTGAGASDHTMSVGGVQTTCVPGANAYMRTASSASVATPSAGTGTTSATPATQASPDTTPPDAITDLSATSSTTTTITLSWTAPHDVAGTGSAWGYEVRYSTAGAITTDNWATATNYTQGWAWAPLTAGSAESRIISGLTQGITYWFAIKAWDAVPNYSGVSNSASAKVTTTSAPPTGTTSGTSAEAMGQMQLKLAAVGATATVTFGVLGFVFKSNVIESKKRKGGVVLFGILVFLYASYYIWTQLLP